MARKPSRAVAAAPTSTKKPTAPDRPAKKAAPPARAAKVEAKAFPEVVAPAKNGVSAHKNGAAKPAKTVNGAATKAPAPRSKADARADLVARAAVNEQGATVLRSDPLADAQAARRVVAFAQSHASEFARRGLSPTYGEAALALAGEVEEHLKALPAAATAVRARSLEVTELISDAAALATPARDAVCRVTRGSEGRKVAHAFGIGQAYSTRQPHHVLRALRRVVAGAAEFPQISADAGILADDLRAMSELADELAELAGPANGGHDDAAALHEAHGALRAWFDLVAAKGTMAFAADPEERARLLALLPRGAERRHFRRAAEESPAA